MLTIVVVRTFIIYHLFIFDYSCSTGRKIVQSSTPFDATASPKMSSVRLHIRVAL